MCSQPREEKYTKPDALERAVEEAYEEYRQRLIDSIQENEKKGK